jgi:hypothetical protein
MLDAPKPITASFLTAVVAIIGAAILIAGIAYGLMPTGIGCGSGFSPEKFAGDGCEVATTDRKSVAWTLVIAGVGVAAGAGILAAAVSPKTGRGLQPEPDGNRTQLLTEDRS